MIESSSPSSSVRTIIPSRNNFENDVIDTPSSVDIQSQHQLSSDTNIHSSSAVSNSFSSFPQRLILESSEAKTRGTGDIQH